MMQVLLRAFHIHISGIPFVSESRNTVNTPVDKNSEFISCIPLRRRMLTERIPGIRVWSLCDHLIDQRKVFFFFHLFVLFTSFIYIVWMSLCYHQTFWLYMPNNSQIKRFVFIQNIQQKKDLDDVFVPTSSKSFLFYIIFSSITFSIRLFTSSASSVVCISLYSS